LSTLRRQPLNDDSGVDRTIQHIRASYYDAPIRQAHRPSLWERIKRAFRWSW